MFFSDNFNKNQQIDEAFDVNHIEKMPQEELDHVLNDQNTSSNETIIFMHKIIEEEEEREKNNPMTYIGQMTPKELEHALDYSEVFSKEEINMMFIRLEDEDERRIEIEDEGKNILLDK